MYYRVNSNNVFDIISRVPDAVVLVHGSKEFPKIEGIVKFYQRVKGVIVFAQVSGLPVSAEKCGNDIFAFHIHSGPSCTGNANDSFADAGTHYNPTDCPHPYHSGDMPPLFSANGNAYLAFLTDRFTAKEIIGKTVVIHDKPDDFTTQPSGNSGKKIACGEIVAVRR